MQTKFDIGDEVFLTGKIEHIRVTPDYIIYRVEAHSRDGVQYLSVNEDELMLKKKGNAKNGNKVG